MRLRALGSLILLALVAGPLAAQANRLVRVPQDAKNLGIAIDRVADGGVILMAAGSYASPSNGFVINNERKGFIVRAAAGAAVALDGGGSRPLLRYFNSDRARGKRVTFERIIFRNGFSTDGNESGGVTLQKADALFRGCTFIGNRTGGRGTGGAAVKVLEGSSVSFMNTAFRDNSAVSRGGAMSVRSATVTIQGGEFLRNRTNLAGHNPGSAGGAIYVLDGTLNVSNARFEANEAGWVGGAIYAIGTWTKGSNVVVNGGTFVANQAVGHPCCTIPAATTGGALHAEDLTTMQVRKSLFLRNRADTGGAVDNYRAVVEIHDSVFQGNQTTLVKPTGGAGGAISAFSSDFTEPAVNRRSARLVINRSLLHGGSEVAQVPQGGGCLLAAGDSARMFGGGQVPPVGTLEQNRAQVEIRGTIFRDCDVQQAATGGGGAGGAVTADLVDLLIEDSLIFDSDARGASGAGGGIALRQESLGRIRRTTFARNSADRFGGAVFARGSTLEITGGRFYRNRVAQGLSTGLADSRGAALFTIPLSDPVRPRSASGVVSGSVFSENEGIPVWDIDPQTGPGNEMRYNGNRFNPIVFGDRVYFNSASFPSGASVAQLNSFTRKVQVPNERIFNPREGVLVVVPSPNSVGANPPAPTRSVVGYAWTGGSATLGIPVDKAGVFELNPGTYTLMVDGVAVATAQVPASAAARSSLSRVPQSAAGSLEEAGTCAPGPASLCLGGSRILVELTWKDGAATRMAQAVPLSGETGYFYFTSPDDAAVLVKVLDARQENGHFWVFFEGLTNQEYTLTVTDTYTGRSKTYRNPSGRFTNRGDTTALPGL